MQIPPKATFESLKEYYGTVFHELVHATEHESRLNWSRKDKDKTYALGELIAELGGVFVCRELGVPASDDLTNHIAYLGNWLQAMKNDSRFIIMASAQAEQSRLLHPVVQQERGGSASKQTANWSLPDLLRERSPAT